MTRELWTPPISSRNLGRRDVLRMLGLGGAAVASSSVLAACGLGTGGAPTQQNGANEVTGGFDWRKAQGTEISILQTPHPYQVAFQPLLAEFTELTDGYHRLVDALRERGWLGEYARAVSP